MATYYATRATVANKGDYHGEHCIYTSFYGSATASAGDVVVACRIPSGVMVTEVLYQAGAAAGDAGVSKVGISGSAEQFLVSDTYTAATAVKATLAGPTGAIGYVFSASDEATIRYQNVIVTPMSGISVGQWFDLIVKYVNRA